MIRVINSHLREIKCTNKIKNGKGNLPIEDIFHFGTESEQREI